MNKRRMEDLMDGVMNLKISRTVSSMHERVHKQTRTSDYNGNALMIRTSLSPDDVVCSGCLHLRSVFMIKSLILNNSYAANK